MESSIFEYRDYKLYLLDVIKSAAQDGRGKRKQLAESIGCQVSHISNVLAGPAHFTQEQAESGAHFFGLNHDETEFFLNLVQFARAGTDSLKKFLEKTLAAQAEHFLALKSRLRMRDSIEKEYEARYYSSWHYGAVHVILSIPEFQDREAIARRLEIPLARVDEILQFLDQAGLARKIGLKYQLTRSTIHLDKASPLIAKHHTNWRLRSILALDRFDAREMHYSSAITLSEKDIPRVREVLAKALTECMKIITKSKEENVAAMNIDLFML